MKVSYGSIVVACLFVPLFPFVEREIERDARYVRRGVGGVVGAWHDVCVRAWTCACVHVRALRPLGGGSLQRTLLFFGASGRWSHYALFISFCLDK